jgi:hypothetical protein
LTSFAAPSTDQDYLLGRAGRLGLEREADASPYDGTCRVCGTALPAKAEAIYERTTKTVRCSTHEDAEHSKALTPGSEPDPQSPS